VSSVYTCSLGKGTVLEGGCANGFIYGLHEGEHDLVKSGLQLSLLSTDRHFKQARDSLILKSIKLFPHPQPKRQPDHPKQKRAPTPY
jgi:hypothetical protein